jgi:hypothetical protein
MGGGAFPGYKPLAAKANRRSTNSRDLSIALLSYGSATQTVSLRPFRLPAQARATELSPRALGLKRQIEKKEGAAPVAKANRALTLDLI